MGAVMRMLPQIGLPDAWKSWLMCLAANAMPIDLAMLFSLETHFGTCPCFTCLIQEFVTQQKYAVVAVSSGQCFAHGLDSQRTPMVHDHRKFFYEVFTSVAPHQEGTAAPSSVASCRAADTAVKTVNSRSPNSSFARLSACHNKIHKQIA